MHLNTTSESAIISSNTSSLSLFRGLKMIMGKDKLAKKLLEKSGEAMQLVTSDFALYEAISCVTIKEMDLNSLKEFLFKVDIFPSPKIKIDMDRIDHLREVIKDVKK